MKILLVAAAACVLAFGNAGLAAAAKDGVKKSKKKAQQSTPQNPVAADMVKDPSSAEKSPVGPWFPDWTPPGFHFNARPLIGYQQSTYRKVDGSKIKDSSSELGLALGLSGVAVVPGNPGLYVAPQIGYAAGAVATTVSPAAGPDATSTGRYTRAYGDIDFIAFYRFYRHTLGLGRGEKRYSGGFNLIVKSAAIRNDFGVLVLDWFSAHLTHSFVSNFHDSASKPFIATNDFWLHGTMFFNVMSLRIDSGPGFTVVDEYVEDDFGQRLSHGAGRSDYLRADASLRLVWKLGASGGVRYVYAATTDDLGHYPGFKSPEQGLQDTSHAPVPEDTLTSSVFLGLFDLFGGLGVGWRQNNVVYNLNEKHGRKSESSSEQGFGVFYQTQI